MKKIIKRKTENITAETTKRTIEKAIKRTVINLFFLFPYHKEHQYSSYDTR